MVRFSPCPDYDLDTCRKALEAVVDLSFVQEGMTVAQDRKQQMAEAVEQFRLPSYQEIPNVGLFLEQVTKYISVYLEPLPSFSMTGSMISNYVKKKLVDNPVKKQYSREQIAYLFFIAVTKSVMSLEELQLLIGLQKLTYSMDVAYEYFRKELENVLQYVFGLKPQLDTVGTDATEEKNILRNTIMAVAHKVYLDQTLLLMRQTEDPEA